MKHIFIVNPKAGQTDHESIIHESLKKYDNTIDYEIYRTTAPRDATRFIKQYCSVHHEEVCFYACGGDGTLNEVINGVVGFPYAYVSIYACGSGNDFVKYYGGVDKFLDIDNLINGTPHKIDVIKVRDRYSVNIVNFGFDTAVCQTMTNVRRKPIIGGKRAYTTGVVKALFTAMKNECTVKVDGIPLNEDKMLLCTIANAQYVGGAFRCAPKATLDDGMLDVCLITPVSRFKFIKLVKDYTEGRHLDNPEFASIMKYKRGKKVEVIAPEGFAITLDGEIVENNHFVAEVVPEAVNFMVPAGAYPIVEDQFVKENPEKIHNATAQ